MELIFIILFLLLVWVLYPSKTEKEIYKEIKHSINKAETYKLLEIKRLINEELKKRKL